MKKKLVVMFVVVMVILGAGYLGGVAYSRHVFAEQMARTVAQLNASSDLTVEQRGISRGFFHTEGTLLIGLNNVAIDQRPVQIELPFRARHGILSTDFDGSIDIQTDPQGKYLFNDYLSPGKSIDLDAKIANLEGTGDLTLTLPAIDLDNPDHTVTLHGGLLHFSGQPGDMTLNGTLEAFAYQNTDDKIMLGPLSFSTHYSSQEHDFGQRDELNLASLSIHRRNALPIALTDIHYTGQTSLESKELRYLMHLMIGGASVSQQRLGSATMSASLDRINGEAASRFFNGLQDRFAAQAPQATPDSQEDWLDMIAPLEESFFAMFKQSPRLTIDQLQLESPMLEQTMQLEGSMVLDGTHIDQMHIDDLREKQGQQSFYNRLHGDFTLSNTPPLLALIAGVAPDQSTLNITFDDSTLSINQQPWYNLD
ncbi:DUF945 family protein [Phytohalomonas tamaricis]|uniref:DUF945 family protein n=1 Tax=Phytohalomonas tamaricis TaxID=2081032 RepID=UPI000D0AD376|nr:DUF945 family protein [Phytohalomonas tamaricis]